MANTQDGGEWVEQELGLLSEPQPRDNPPGPAQNKRKAASPVDVAPKKQQKVYENRAVFASNIPRDATFEEIVETFQKAGMIEMGLNNKPRVKMYADKDGNFNGNVLVVYFKKESIGQAILRIDGWEFRLGKTSDGVVKVEEANASHKVHTDGDIVKTKLSRSDRKAAERNRAEMQRKLAEWSDDDEEVLQKTYAPKKNKWAKYVIIKRAFEIEQINEEGEEGAILEIKDDMRNAAKKFGEVTKVVLYDKEPEGIVTVRFAEFDAAENFVKAYNGKGYNENPLELSIANDRPQFKKSGKDGPSASDVEDNVRRLEAYMAGDKTDEESD